MGLPVRDWDEYHEDNNYRDGTATLKAYDEYVRDLIGRAGFWPGCRVLEAGCGSGTVTDIIIEQQPEIELVGLDISPVGIEQAQTRFAGHPGLDFACADFNESRWTEPYLASFDFYVSMNVIYAVDDVVQHLRDAHACLKPGGVLVLSNAIPGSDGKLDFSGVIERQEEFLASATPEELALEAAVAPKRAKITEINMRIRERGDEQHFWPPDTLAAAVIDAGFDIAYRNDHAYEGLAVVIIARKR